MAGPAAGTDTAAAVPPAGRNPPEEHVDMEKRTLIFDSSAFISNARIFHAGESPFFGALDGTSKLFAVPDLVREVRDPMARERMQMIADKINFVTPSVESMNFVKSFASKTGDLGALSVVDLQVVALTFQLEKERNGMRNIKTEPVSSVIPLHLQSHGGVSTLLPFGQKESAAVWPNFPLSLLFSSFSHVAKFCRKNRSFDCRRSSCGRSTSWRARRKVRQKKTRSNPLGMCCSNENTACAFVSPNSERVLSPAGCRWSLSWNLSHSQR